MCGCQKSLPSFNTFEHTTVIDQVCQFVQLYMIAKDWLLLEVWAMSYRDFDHVDTDTNMVVEK